MKARILWLGVLCACGAEVQEREEHAGDRELLSFSTPESALWDERDDAYLVSNIDGDPFAKDGNGFISRVTAVGQPQVINQLRWIDGSKEGVELNAPKGMALRGDELFVADIDHVRRFDRESGEHLGSVAFEGATFLNDIALGPEGWLYVTDSGFAPGFEPNGTDAIYRIGPELELETVVTSKDLGNPNGIAFGDKGDLFVVNWTGGEFMMIGKDGTIAARQKLPAKKLDGLVRTPDGRWYASSWEGRCVYEIGLDGRATVRVGDVDAPADIGYDGKRGRLLIPLFQSDRLLCKKP